MATKKKLPQTPEAAERAAKMLREKAGKMDQRASDLKKKKAAKCGVSSKITKEEKNKKSLEKQLAASNERLKKYKGSAPGCRRNKAA